MSNQNLLRPPVLILNNIPEDQALEPIIDNNPIEMANLFPAGFQISMLTEIPTYDGNTSTLSEFIRSVEVILNQFLVPGQPNAYVNKFLLSSVRNKLKGNALEVIAGYEYDTWLDLKTTLISNFGDQRSELNLTIDLAKTRQNSKESPIEFYNRIRTLLATFNSKISLGNEDIAIKNYKLTNTKNLALRAYLSGLNEPFGSLLRGRNPDSLESAVSIIRDELDIRYSQNTSKNHFNPPIHNQNLNPNNSRHNPQNLYTPRFNNFVPNNYTPFQNYQYLFSPRQRELSPNNSFMRNQNPTIRLNPNNRPSQFPNQRPFGTKNQNVFAPQRGFRNTTPGEPMQLGSENKRPPSMQSINPNNPKRPNNYQNTQYIRQSNQPRNFHAEELFYHDDNTDPNNYSNNYLDNYPDNYVDQPEYDHPYNYDCNETNQEDDNENEDEAVGNFPN